MDFHSAKVWSRELIEEALLGGGIAIDATMGNGNDTKWLCELAGDTGRVYAFDVQPQAVENTRKRLEQSGLLNRAILINAGHEHMSEYVKEKADAVVFNLGWLPGTQHAITTKTQTTLQAVQSALEIMSDGAVMTICAYPGHEEGSKERTAIIDWAQSLDPKSYDCILKTYLNQPNNPPCMIAVQKKYKGAKP